MKTLALTVTLFVALTLPATAAPEVFKHSGTLVAADENAGTIVLEEVGPWRVKAGVTQITRRIIEVTPSTMFTIVRRVAVGKSGFPNDFVELFLDPWEFYDRDLVTVECLHEEGRMIALKITVFEIGKP